MAQERIITCQDCGHHEITKAANTKRCHVCRLDQNLLFVRGRLSKCYRCSQRFCPIARDDALCPKCAFVPGNSELVQCVFCHEHSQSVSHAIAVCMACARDKTHRRQFEQAITAKVETRKASDPGPPPIMEES